MVAALAAASWATAAPRLSERTLGDIGTIQVPAELKAERYSAYADEAMHRVAFQFSSRYLWASMSGVARYRQIVVVSVLAADAGESLYAARPRDWPISYVSRKPASRIALAAGQTLQVTEGVYEVSTDREPAFEYLYTDRARRLQILWHAVKSEHDAGRASATIERMAASFRLQRDPVARMAEARAQPALDAAERERRRATARAMLQREGFGAAEPGRPVWHRGMHVEWMSEPEARYQVLVPLGRLPAPTAGAVGPRLRLELALNEIAPGIGWRVFADGAWHFANRDGGYLPQPGIAAAMAAQQGDPAYLYVYWAQTVRVDEEADPARLQSLDAVLAALPQVRQRWLERAAALEAPAR